MSGEYLIQYEYALQKIVESFGDLLSQLEEAHLTHPYQVVFSFCQVSEHQRTTIRGVGRRVAV
jgi:hypothetical protein